MSSTKGAKNCVDTKINHIQIRNDSLVFQFTKSKGHRHGEKHVGSWHAYATPEELEVCVVLDLTLYLFTYPHIHIF